ncbi:hypothetical protein [Pantoea dispersa]|uniref:hypothetical protein n=1 Tax=Pantoea dispersa TaxID=59814 RepID=UPI001CA7A630|nr:hypothetical protein [Pantoea dispersa]QZY95986.1 hypothetical protein K7X52_05980 [Pantoea dispersa]
MFESYKDKVCCLCGSEVALTGEHKIKASALRSIFGKSEMVIGSFSDEKDFRSAQGPKSKAFHFSARMCSLCNGSRTQPADHEFDHFHNIVSALVSNGQNPTLAFDMPEYGVGSERFLNLFRYFSKILCCQIAESCGPRIVKVCDFAIGKTNNNIVFLNISIDPIYEDYRKQYGSHSYAAHGGLIVPFSSSTKNPTGFRTFITLGEIRYTFWIRLNAVFGMVLRMFHYQFWRKCEIAYQEALKKPLSDEQRKKLGL